MALLAVKSRTSLFLPLSSHCTSLCIQAIIIVVNILVLQQQQHQLDQPTLYNIIFGYAITMLSAIEMMVGGVEGK